MTNFRTRPNHKLQIRLVPSPGIPGEGQGEGDFELSTTFAVQNHPHPRPLPGVPGEGGALSLIYSVRWNVSRTYASNLSPILMSS